MKAQEILSKIKEVVGIELSEEVSVQLEEIKLENGTVLVAEKFESGQSVFIKSEDDENIALPIGEYDMEDGRKLMVKEEGLIDAIGEVEVEEEVEASEETEEEKVEVEAEEEEVEMEYVTKEEFSKAVEEIKGMIENMSKEEMKEEVEKEELSAEVAEPVVHNPEAKSETKSLFKKSYPNTIQNRIYQKLNN